MFEFLHRNRETIPVIVHNLGFIINENWKKSLFKKTNQKDSERFRIKLVKASEGVGDCMDERPAKKRGHLGGGKDIFTERNTEQPKPSFVGGAAGFAFMFLAANPTCTVRQAVERTKQLYEAMNWGDMEIHIDNEHGHITDPAQLLERTSGCGFLGVSHNVLDVLRELDLTKRTIDQSDRVTFGQAIFTALRQAGAKTVVLDGNHDPDAKIVINQIEGKTYPKNVQFHTQPAFCWDMWATANQEVYNQFCVISGISPSEFTLNHFQQIQTVMHLATGMLLGVARLGRNGNVVITSNE